MVSGTEISSRDVCCPCNSLTCSKAAAEGNYSFHFLWWEGLELSRVPSQFQPPSPFATGVTGHHCNSCNESERFILDCACCSAGLWCQTTTPVGGHETFHVNRSLEQHLQKGCRRECAHYGSILLQMGKAFDSGYVTTPLLQLLWVMAPVAMLSCLPEVRSSVNQSGESCFPRTLVKHYVIPARDPKQCGGAKGYCTLILMIMVRFMMILGW